MIFIPFVIFGVEAHLNCLADSILGGDSRAIFAKRSEEGVKFEYESEKPELWGTLSSNFTQCKEGKNQSPINFEDKKMLGPKKFKMNWDKVITNPTILNDGHAVKVEIPPNSQLSIIPDGQSDPFELQQFHFHLPSEHHRLEEGLPMEVHFVHSNAKNDIAVVGVWFTLSETSSPFLREVMNKGVPVAGAEKMTLPSLDFKSMGSLLNDAPFWSYEGSLTTPPCSENVRWGVSDVTLPISVKHYEMLRKGMKFNARPTQQHTSQGEGAKPATAEPAAPNPVAGEQYPTANSPNPASTAAAVGKNEYILTSDATSCFSLINTVMLALLL
ncbi:hypothetical protein HDV02_003269 [Globomyces sp. JEL0801]|nr:hypothetical protein HDV02_003269 [Globomyces sp. JEL0801]